MPKATAATHPARPRAIGDRSGSHHHARKGLQPIVISPMQPDRRCNDLSMHLTERSGHPMLPLIPLGVLYVCHKGLTRPRPAGGCEPLLAPGRPLCTRPLAASAEACAPIPTCAWSSFIERALSSSAHTSLGRFGRVQAVESAESSERYRNRVHWV